MLSLHLLEHSDKRAMVPKKTVKDWRSDLRVSKINLKTRMITLLSYLSGQLCRHSWRSSVGPPDQSPGELAKAVQRTLSWSGCAAPYLAQQLPMATINNADPMNQDQALSEASGVSSSSTAPPSATKQAIR